MRIRALAGLAVLAAAGCGGTARSPEAAVRALDEATRSGDVDAVMQRLGPRSRARLEAAAKRAGEQAGRRRIAPSEFLAAGWTPPEWEPESVRLIDRRGDDATVEVRGPHGEELERIEVLREGKEWKVELP